jgi:acyl carrier protein
MGSVKQDMIKIEEKIKKMIADVVEIDLERVKETAFFIDDLGADSLDRVELMIRIEKEYQIRISDIEIVKFKTVKNLLDFMKQKLLS